MRSNPDFATFTIRSFWDIGWADPFAIASGNRPKAACDLKLPTHPDHLVYSECRYTEKYSPYVVYIPSKEVMFKIMRACIKVKNIEDLWINN